MTQYTEKDKQAFRLKDYLNSRMNAAKATSVIYEGKAIEFEKFQTFAESILNWVWEGQGDVPIPLFQDQERAESCELPKPEKKPDKATLPKPNPAANKVLVEIIKQNTVPMSNEVVMRKTLEWAKSVHDVEQYPRDMNSVKEVLEWLKN